MSREKVSPPKRDNSDDGRATAAAGPFLQRFSEAANGYATQLTRRCDNLDSAWLAADPQKPSLPLGGLRVCQRQVHAMRFPGFTPASKRHTPS